MVNKVILVGNLGKDPEVRYTSGGQAVANMSVATERSWFDKQANKRVKETEWHAIEAWGKLAELCGEHLEKGRQVYIEGRLKTETWDDKKDGSKRSRVKIVADNVRFLGSAKDARSRPKSESDRDRDERGRPADEPRGHEPPSDDIPF